MSNNFPGGAAVAKHARVINRVFQIISPERANFSELVYRMFHVSVCMSACMRVCACAFKCVYLLYST